MIILAQNIVKNIAPSYFVEFTGSEGNKTEHPTTGKQRITLSQFVFSSAEYKNKLYNNVIECLNSEIKDLSKGVYTLDEPLVGGAYIKMLYKHHVFGCHDLNRRLKYPELMEIVDAIAKVQDTLKTEEINKRVNEETQKVVSKMPYKRQFVFECLGYEV